MNELCPSCGVNFWSVIWDVCAFCRGQDKHEAYFNALDPRTDEERELDQLDQEWRETINSIRPGL